MLGTGWNLGPDDCRWDARREVTLVPGHGARWARVGWSPGLDCVSGGTGLGRRPSRGSKGIPVWSALLVLGLFGLTSCRKKSSEPAEPVPEVLFPKRDLRALDEELEGRLSAAAGTLCARRPILGRALRGEGTQALAQALADRQGARVCRSAPRSEACGAFFQKLGQAVQHERVCSPGRVDRLGGKPVLSAKDLVEAAVAAGRASRGWARFRPLLQAGLAVWDMARGPVVWWRIGAASEAMGLLVAAFRRTLNETQGRGLSRRHRDHLVQSLAALVAARPNLRGALLGDHVARLAAAGLLGRRVATASGMSDVPVPAAPLSQAGPDRRAWEDYRAVARVLAARLFERAWKACDPSAPIRSCVLRLDRISRDRAKLAEELGREFLARYERYAAFERLVRSVDAEAEKGADVQAGEATDESPGSREEGSDQGPARRVWGRLLNWAYGFPSETALAFGRACFLVSAVLLHAKVVRFVRRHPSLAHFAKVAPLAFQVVDPASGKPLRVARSPRGIEVLPPGGEAGPKYEIFLRARH